MSAEVRITRSAIRAPAKVGELKKIVKSLEAAYGELIDPVTFLAVIGKSKKASYDDPTFRTEMTLPPDFSPYLVHGSIDLWHPLSKDNSINEVATQFEEASSLGCSQLMTVKTGKRSPFVVSFSFKRNDDRFQFKATLLFSPEGSLSYWPVKDHPEFWDAAVEWFNDRLWPSLGLQHQIVTTVSEQHREYKFKHTSSDDFKSCGNMKLHANPHYSVSLLVDSFDQAQELLEAACAEGTPVRDEMTFGLSFANKRAYQAMRARLKEFGTSWSARALVTFEKTKDPFKRPSRISANDPPQWTVASLLYGGEAFVNIVHEKEGSYLEFCSHLSAEQIESLWSEAGETPQWWTGEPAARWE